MLVFSVAVFLRILRRPHFPQPTDPKADTISKKEIVEETTKISCSYCDNLYDEKSDRCPHCGAPRKNVKI